jgi:hypothetical protein
LRAENGYLHPDARGWPPKLNVRRCRTTDLGYPARISAYRGAVPACTFPLEFPLLLATRILELSLLRVDAV